MERWNADAEMRDTWLAKLKVMLDELRSLPAPATGGVQNVLGGPLANMRLELTNDNLLGPFNSVRDFHTWLRDDFDGEIQPDHGRPKFPTET